MIITPEKYDAVLFDMDGVLTSTMKIHASSWKHMFDAYLESRAERFGETHHPFEIGSDYKTYVDGKLRYDGVRSFLASRNITLPEGTPDEPPDSESICGLGNRKDLLVKDIIASEGVVIIEGSLNLVRRVRSLGLGTAVVSASKNCGLILQVAGIEDLFDCVVDGNVAEQLGLAGKPAPDTFLSAANSIGVDPQRAVVIEDAVSGVAAGQAGGFGLVIGIDHHGDKQMLLEHGADIVVEDLTEILDGTHNERKDSYDSA